MLLLQLLKDSRVRSPSRKRSTEETDRQHVKERYNVDVVAHGILEVPASTLSMILSKQNE